MRGRGALDEDAPAKRGAKKVALAEGSLKRRGVGAVVRPWVHGVGSRFRILFTLIVAPFTVTNLLFDSLCVVAGGGGRRHFDGDEGEPTRSTTAGVGRGDRRQGARTGGPI